MSPSITNESLMAALSKLDVQALHDLQKRPKPQDDGYADVAAKTSNYYPQQQIGGGNRCPRCGYCPSCGRGGEQHFPNPQMPYSSGPNFNQQVGVITSRPSLENYGAF